MRPILKLPENEKKSMGKKLSNKQEPKLIFASEENLQENCCTKKI